MASADSGKTADKEKEYEKMSVARYIHFGKNKTIVQNGV